MSAQTTKQIIKVTYNGCGHIVHNTSESIASTTLVVNGDCPRCQSAPLLVYLFEDNYYVHFPAAAQPDGMGSLAIPTPYTSATTREKVIEVVQAEYPMRRVLAAEVLSPTRYAALKRLGFIVADEHELERARLVAEESAPMPLIVVLKDAVDAECVPLSGAPFLDDSHVTFEEIDAVITRSAANREALAGRTAQYYCTHEHTARTVAQNENLTIVVLPEQLPPTRTGGEPYRYALVAVEK